MSVVASNEKVLGRAETYFLDFPVEKRVKDKANDGTNEAGRPKWQRGYKRGK